MPTVPQFLGRYLEAHPDSKLGLPGPQQGLNTGVVLYQVMMMVMVVMMMMMMMMIMMVMMMTLFSWRR